IRPARRPEGWEAPGPKPRGAAGRLHLLPGEDEDLSYLVGDFRLFQKLRGHRWSLDDLVTAWFAARQVEDPSQLRHVDLGCGIGSVLLMISWRHPCAKSIGVEAQTVSAELARRSVEWNGVEG